MSQITKITDQQDYGTKDYGSTIFLAAWSPL